MIDNHVEGMNMEMNTTQTKTELLSAACYGIRKFLDSIRGARLRAEVTAIGGGILQIKVPTETGPEYYEVRISKIQKGR